MRFDGRGPPRREALPGTTLPTPTKGEGIASGRASQDDRTRLRKVGKFSHGAPGARARTPHRRPGGSHPRGTGSRRGTRQRARRRPPGSSPLFPTTAAVDPRHARTRARGPPAQGRSPGDVAGEEERRRREGPGLSPGQGQDPPVPPPPPPPKTAPGPPPPTHGADGRPPGVFKPPRRNALGTWTGGADGGGKTAAPTLHHQTAGHRQPPPTPPTPVPATAARGPRAPTPVTGSTDSPPTTTRTDGRRPVGGWGLGRNTPRAGGGGGRTAGRGGTPPGGPRSPRPPRETPANATRMGTATALTAHPERRAEGSPRRGAGGRGRHREGLVLAGGPAGVGERGARAVPRASNRPSGKAGGRQGTGPRARAARVRKHTHTRPAAGRSLARRQAPRALR